MAHFLLMRSDTTFKGFRSESPNAIPVFSVQGAQAARAAVRLLGIVTPIKDYFFDNPHGSHMYNCCDDPHDPYLGSDRPKHWD